jgi:Bacterial Ig-like domain/Bacterial Ig domain/LVIVD repeat
MPPRPNRRRPTRRQLTYSPSILPLEQRVLLADGSNIFAHLQGEINSFPSAGVSTIQLSASNFSTPRRQVVLGFVASGEPAGLDPGGIQVKPFGRLHRSLSLSKQDIPGSRSSLTLASLGTGTFELKVDAQHGTTGAYQIDVFLAGDANGDYRVDREDLSLIRSLLPGWHAGFSRRRSFSPGGYKLEADADRDGRITIHDYHLALRNLGASTNVRPLTLTADLLTSPAVTLPDGTVATSVVNQSIAGMTLPGAVVQLDIAQDGSVDATQQANNAGAFGFGVALAEGPNAFEVSASDAFGQTATATLRVLLDTMPPAGVLDLRASSDSGASDTDNVTNDATPTLDVLVEDGASVLLFVDGVQTADAVAAGGMATFTIGPLAHGPHTIQAHLRDAVGNTATTSLSITVDTEPPTLPEFDLATGSDTDPPGDHQTTLDVVTLSGQTAANMAVTLLQTGAATMADTAGMFSFAGVNLALGGNSFTVRATDPAGNSSDFTRIITRAETGEQDLDPPVISAALANDTGASNSDKVTQDPTVTGTVVDASAIASFLAGFDGAAIGAFVSVLQTLQPGGAFTLDADTIAQINGGPLAEGQHTLHLLASDSAGNTSPVFDLAFTLEAPSTDVSTPDLLPASDTGASATDNVTSNSTPTVRIVAAPGSIVSLAVDGVLSDPVTAMDGFLDFTTGLLNDGVHSLTAVLMDGAGAILSSSGSLSIRVDTVEPTLNITTPGTAATIVPGSHLIGMADGTGSALGVVSYHFDSEAAHSVVAGAGGTFDQAMSMAGLSNGGHTLTVSATDLAGNIATTEIEIVLSGVPFALASFTPLDGADGVGAMVHPRINFSEPVNAASLTAANFFATAGGAAVPASIVVDPGGMYARLFLNGPMPSGSEVTITVDGSTILAKTGGAMLDADNDRVAGGVRHFGFTTVSTFALPGTMLSGRIADAGPDLVPLTADDTEPGPDGLLGTPDDILLLPLTDVKLFFRGLEGAPVSTIAGGSFLFDAAPAGAVTLTIQGAFATAPAGFTFPELNADLTLIAGIGNSIGTIYLPRLADEVVQNVDTSVATTLTLPAAGAMGLTEEQRQLFTLQIAPNALLGPDGQPVANAQVVMSMLPNDTIKPFLPPTLPEPVMVFTTQLRGASDIAQPFHATFPNLSGANVGDEFIVLSFDQATGKLVQDGTAVAVASAGGASVAAAGFQALQAGEFERTGDFIMWDPGGEGGLVACFHLLLPKFGGGGGVSPVSSSDCDPDVLPSEFVFPVFLDNDTFKDHFFTSDNGSFNLHFENAAEAMNPALEPCDPENQEASPLKVELTLEEVERQLFIDGLQSQTFYLYPQESKDFSVLLRRLLNPEDLDPATSGRLFGATIKLKGTVIDPKTGTEIVVFDQSLYVYRFWDIADTDHIDGMMEFERTLADGQAGIMRDKPLSLIMPDSAKPTITANGAAYSYVDMGGAVDLVRFDPQSVGTHGGGLKILSPNNESVGTILLQGRAIPQTIIDFSRSHFVGSIALIVDTVNSDWTNFQSMFPSDANGNTLRSDEPGFQAIANNLYDQIIEGVELVGYGFDAQVFNAIKVVDGGGGIVVNDYVSVDGSNELIDGDRTLGQSNHVDFARSEFNQMVANQENTSLPQEEFLLASFVNRSPNDPGPRYTGIALKIANLAANRNLPGPDFQHQFATLTANIVTHEVGHSLAAIHSRNAEDAYLHSDVMGFASRETLLTFSDRYTGLIKEALGIPMTDTEFGTAVEYYKAMVNRETQGFPQNHGALDEAELEERLLNVYGSPLAVNQPVPNRVTSQAFDTVVADGPGGQEGTVTLYLFSSGNHELTISDIALLGGNAGFSIQDVISFPLVLPPLDLDNLQPDLSQFAITLKFDPSTVGAATDVLRIVSDSLADDAGGVGVDIDIPLSGLGVSPDGDIVVEVENNNLGGVKVGGGAVTATDLATIRNIGASALSISAISIADGEGQFALTGLPANLSASIPLIIAPGDTFTFGATFDATHTGLQRAHIQIASSDPDLPIVSQTVVGTGLADSGSALEYGHDYVAVQVLNIPNAPALRQISDANGNWGFYLTAGQPFRHVIFDPVSGLIHDTSDITSTTGVTEVLLPVFHSSTAPDSDGDGLPDDVEFAIGTSIDVVDSDGDGVDDFAEIALGNNPLDGVATPTGVISGLPLPGEAWDIAITDNTALIATGDHGLAVVDITNPIKPILVSAKDLSGFIVSVAVDQSRALAALASDLINPGLHIVSIADPANVQLLRTVPLAAGASHVEVLDGVAYVSSGSAVVAIELVSGDVLQTLDLGGANVTGLTRDGNRLYAIDSAGELSSIDISGFQAAVLDTLMVADGAGGELFAGGGVLYAAAKGSFRGGFATVDVSNPANLALISGTDVLSGFRPDRAVAADGSGLALAVGVVPNPLNPLLSLNVVDVAVVTDPADTNAYVTRFTLPQSPLGLALASGVAFIADGSADLLVIGYQSAAGAGQPPMASISTTTADADPVAPGIQVVAGTPIHLQAGASDDTNVRRVEFLIDEQVVATDSSFPYEAIVPAGSAGSTLQVQARAVDIAGNTALSNALTLQVIADTFAPTILTIDPANGATLPEGLQKVRVRFDESLDPVKATAANFQLLQGSQLVAPASLELLSEDRVVQLNFAGLTAGSYQLVIHGASVTDLAGNALSAGDVTSNFTLTGGSKDWVNPAGGFWDDPSNWEDGTLPGPDDNVVIDVPGNATITFRTGNVVVNRIISKEALDITGGVLEVTTTVQVDAAFTLGLGGTLRGATILPGAGGQEPHVVSAANLDGVTLLSNLTIDDLGTAFIQNGLTLNNARITLASSGSTTMLFFDGDQTLAGTGEIFFGGTSNNPNDAVDSGGTLTIGPGITIRGIQNGSVGSSFTNQTIILQGMILADTTGKTIVLGGIDSRIQGLVHATAGTVELDDSFSFVGAGTFHSDGGMVVLTGTLDNAGKTLAITAATGSLFADGGTVKGGRVETSGGAALTPQFVLNLDGVTLGTDFTVPDGTDVLVKNGLTLDNVNVTLTDGTVAFIPARLRFTDSSTLGGTGEIIFGGTGDSNSLTGTSTFTFTIGPNITVHGPRGGSVGVLGNLVNQGTIAADTSSRMIVISGTTVNNQGTISAANGGRVQFGSAAVNNGLFVANTSSTIQQISGTLLQNGGETRLAGGTIQAATLSIQGGSLTGAGTVNGNLINAGTISFGTVAQPLATINVQVTFQQAATGIIQTTLGGTATNQYGRLVITGAATLAGTLAIQVFPAFTPVVGNVFDILTYSSLNGVFTTVTGLNLAGGLTLVAAQDPTRVRLTVT